MNYQEFQQKYQSLAPNNSKETLDEHRKEIRIKKEKTVVKNLERIFAATLKIGNDKGFHAMSMRDLSEETGLSMGALYAYFNSKENLLVMLQRNGRNNFQTFLSNCVSEDLGPRENLRMVLKTHLFMSETLQEWFYFTYMESKNLNKAERKIAVDFELYTDKIIVDILQQGEKKGVFKAQNHDLTAAMIKAMLNDWYLRRWKYARRNTSVDQYGEYLLDFVESYCCQPDSKI